ncbi:hypothetical protein AMATHDRAFT_3570 [Amanita thiersii Skay4041]|uniref:Protein-S-isoprenylcysteine O-methyltransferase n=1 Tax=Amanita thiersii Skay4041 TaxID=703135 RepID=A0A2A9NT49_9AGAR|nr:hypothetical protein AMATHDRAFT_3570 [Amanita thiersii Skay4041]
MEFELLKAFLLLLAAARLHVSYKSPTPRATVANGALIPSSWERFMRIITAIIPAFRGIFWALALAEAVTIIAKRSSSAIAQKLLSALLLEGRDGSNMGLSQATVIGCTLALIATHIRTRKVETYRKVYKGFMLLELALMNSDSVKVLLLLWATARLHVSYNPPTPRATVASGAVIPSTWERAMRVATLIMPVHRAVFCGLGLAEAVTIMAKQSSTAIARKILPYLLFEGRDGSSIRLTRATVIGCVLGVIAGHIRAECYHELGKYFTFELSVQKDHTLVTTGPYSVVRHPSYTATVFAHFSLLLLQWTRGSWVRESGMLNTTWGKVIMGFESAYAIWITGALLSRTKEEDKLLRERLTSKWNEWAKVPYKLFPGIPVVSILFDEETELGSDNYTLALSQDGDIMNELRLRLSAYHRAWTKCLNRLQSSIRLQHEPVVGDIVQHILNSYTETIVKTPYQEVPVVCVSSSLSGSSIVDDVCASLVAPDGIHEGPRAITINLYASDCPNIMSSMKNIISSLTEDSGVLEQVKRKPTTSVANFDIEMLVAWYDALCHVSENKIGPLLVIVLHDFEQFDPTVVQDLSPVFVLSLASPSSPSYLHLAYPRSTLALLRVDTFVTPSGIHVLERALLQTFFDVEFEPDLMLGPQLLEEIVLYLRRHNISQDIFLTTLQLIHLRHFLLSPLSLFAQETSPRTISLPSLQEILKIRFQEAGESPKTKSPTKKQTHFSSSATITIDQARGDFCHHARRMRVAVGLVMLVHESLNHLSFSEQEGTKIPSLDMTSVMADALQGNIQRHIPPLYSPLRKLDMHSMNSLLDNMHQFLEYPVLVQDQQSARAKVADILALGEKSTEPRIIADELCDWLEDYLEALCKPLDEVHLWDIWYTGNVPLPSEFLNPSIRASILAGLLRPHDYAQDPNTDTSQRVQVPELWELPDISILYRRYTDSGKMINVYDWFESFQMALEAQREHLMKLQQQQRQKDASVGKRSPRKRGANTKEEKQKQNEEVVVDEEKWKLEVQARFMRALQELDYLGFVKHTGRKADHVVRTVFDVCD